MMKKVFNALAIIANFAIVASLVKDTYTRLTPKRENTVTTDFDNEEI